MSATFHIEPLRDSRGERYWALYLPGKDYQPVAIIADNNMVDIANKVLKSGTEIKHLGASITAFRKLNRMTQAEFAERCEVSRNYISQIERDKANNLSVDVYRRIVRMLTI